MNKGRLTVEECERRINLLLKFIFVFRYVTRQDISEFSRIVIGITYFRRLIHYAVSRDLIRTCYNPINKTRFYYLSASDVGLIHDADNLFKEHYRFDRKSHMGVNAFTRHLILVNLYLNIKRQIDIDLAKWKSEWMVRVGRRRRETGPDTVITLPSGIKVAVELILQYRRPKFLKELISYYYYDIEKAFKYHLLFIIVPHHYEHIRKRMYSLSPRFSEKYLIIANLEIINQGMCFCKGGVKGLKEAFELFKIANANTTVKT